MRCKIAILTTIGAFGLATAPAHATVYAIDQSSTMPEVPGELSPLSDTITGTITTDGTIGYLASSNIVDWNLNILDNLYPGYSSHLTPANSGIYVDTGTGLAATATGLTFDFSTPGAVFIIQGLTYGFSSGYQYFCFQATSGPCVTGETIVPYHYSVDGVTATGFSGTVPLNPPAVPEPASWAMMLIGFGVLGHALRKRPPAPSMRVNFAFA